MKNKKTILIFLIIFAVPLIFAVSQTEVINFILGWIDGEESVQDLFVSVENYEVYEESHFGVNLGITAFADEMEEAGIEITREWIEWNKIEPINNQYDWTEMDEKVQAANNKGIEILGYFAFMPRWARNDNDLKCTTQQWKFPLDPCPILDWDDYTEFASNVAERYDGTNYICGLNENEFCGEMKYIGMWNEVQGFAQMNAQEYEPWLIKGYQAVKQGNPNAQVLLGATHAPLDFPGAEGFIETMISDSDYNQYYDIFNFHIYQFDDSSVGDTINYIKDLMNDYAVDKPMWITETAVSMITVKCIGFAWQDTQAKGVIKRYVQALGNGVDKIFWFAFVGLPTEKEDSTGVVCGEPTNFIKGGLGWVYPKGLNLPIHEFHPRPAYWAYKNMTSKLAGFSSVKKINDTMYKFTVRGEDVYVLWCNDGSCVIPSEISGQVTVTDYLGNETIMDANQITLTESPVFVEEIIT
jgi:hypothetical protein